MSDWLEVEKREGKKFMQQLVDENIALRAENAQTKESLELAMKKWNEASQRSFEHLLDLGESERKVIDLRIENAKLKASVRLFPKMKKIEDD